MQNPRGDECNIMFNLYGLLTTEPLATSKDAIKKKNQTVGKNMYLIPS